MKDSTRHLGTERIGRLLFSLSLPSAIGMIVMASYNIVDAIFIGRGVGPLGLAAVVISFPLHLFTGALSIMAGVGGSSIISRSLGSGDYEKAQAAFGTTIFFATAAGLAMATLGGLFLSPLLELLGATPEILPHARAYLKVLLFGMPFHTFAMAGNHMARAEGRARIAMITMLISAIINVILDPIFIFGLGWGMRGAAMATVISQLVMFTWIFGYYYTGRSNLRFTLSCLRPRLAILREIVGIGASEFVRMSAGSISIILINSALVRLGGNTSVAVYGVINRSMSFFFMPLMGIAQGFQPILGFNYGAGNMQRARQAISLAIITATSFAFLGFLVTKLFPEAIFSFFSEDENLIAEGAKAMRVITAVYFLVGFQIIGSSMFQALGKAHAAFILSLSRQVLLLLPLVLLLPRYLGISGVWMAFPAADGLSFFLTLYLFIREIRILNTREDESL